MNCKLCNAEVAPGVNTCDKCHEAIHGKLSKAWVAALYARDQFGGLIGISPDRDTLFAIFSHDKSCFGHTHKEPTGMVQVDLAVAFHKEHAQAYYIFEGKRTAFGPKVEYSVNFWDGNMDNILDEGAKVAWKDGCRSVLKKKKVHKVTIEMDAHMDNDGNITIPETKLKLDKDKLRIPRDDNSDNDSYWTATEEGVSVLITCGVIREMKGG